MKKTRKRQKKIEKRSQGLTPEEIQKCELSSSDEKLVSSIQNDGGQVLAVYRDPLGGNHQMLTALPIEKVKPTPFQRNLSKTHVKRLSEKIEKLGRFLDPIIATRSDEGIYFTPNGFHRLTAMEQLGAKAIVALVVADPAIAYQILALNTEKAHNLREKSLEVIRMAKELLKLSSDMNESEFSLQFEEPSFLTLGICYEENGRFSGGAYQSVLRKTDAFFEKPIRETLKIRQKMAHRIQRLDEKVAVAVASLKKRGLKSPYLKAFVVARINPLRFRKGLTSADFDETFDTMETSLRSFDASKIRPDQLSGMGGTPEA